MPVMAAILEKPSASAAVHSPAASPYTPREARHQRISRLDALDKERSGPQQDMHVARHPLLRRQQQRLDVAAHRIQQLPLVHEITVGLRDQLLDPLLARGQHELLKLAMRNAAVSPPPALQMRPVPWYR